MFGVNLEEIERMYDQIVDALHRARVLSTLSHIERLGVVGVDGNEYPVPTLEQVRAVFEANRELVDWKAHQGFSQLQMTPIAIPVSELMNGVTAALRNRAADREIFLTKRNPTDADIPAQVNAKAPIWIWERVRQALDTPGVVYFPRAYVDRDHGGFTKDEMIRSTALCVVPGWSVGLIEPETVVPKPGAGREIGGRKQLEAESSPTVYLAVLQEPSYADETGWTLEDFLTHFLTRLETTGQISHDRFEGNGMWLVGMYLPHLGTARNVVPVGYWSREIGRKLYLSAHRTGNSLKGWGARTVVRLGDPGG